ncbi:M15 family metallopeptidase [Peribacillus psychrosaccharolyticus]|uniref:M15 family metallopeptidase n=1 Tax=Peribacillus psychrosaccharolyticus TaxID=1407 RepID=UPI003D2E0C1B
MAVSVDSLIKKAETNMGKNINPVVKQTAIEVIKRAYKEKIYVLISNGFRSFEEQDKLYAQGRTNKSKPIVTNARGGYSAHNYGLAIDFVIVSDDGRRAIWTVTDKWRRVASIAKSLGFEWGGEWSSFKDYPHLQMTKGLTMKELLSGKRPVLTSKVPAASSYPGIVYKVKSPLMSGKNVEKIQKAAGMKKSEVDGKYGKKTETAVKAYQKKNKLKVTGTVEKETWDKMF